MITKNITDMFDISYFGRDFDKLLEINALTKTRVDNSKNDVRMHYGIEQSFFIYGMAKKYKCQNFFEIGTGRGTACYSVSLLDDVNSVETFDIVPHTRKSATAVKFKSFFGSNKDIYDLVPYNEKEKIKFNHIYSLDTNYLNKNKGLFDMAFIDGNHSDYSVIMKDFENSHLLTKNDGIIIFDDYGNFPVVTQVANDVMKKYPNYEYILVPFRGHYFQEFVKKEKENNSGELVLIKK
jgi:predicted O-methyltransferase YrrM